MRALLAFLVLSLALPAAAQEAPPPEYDHLIDEAVAEFGAGRWAEARALFERAGDLFPNARALRGLGMAAFEMGDYVTAATALDGALTSPTRPLTDAQRQQVEGLLERCRAYLAHYVLSACPPGAVLRVDGRLTALDGWPAEDATLVLALGRHEIEVRTPEGRSARTRVDVAGSETGPLDLDVASLSAPEPEPEPSREPERAPAPEALPTTAPPADITPWVLAASFGGVAIVGGVLLGAGVADVATVEHAAYGTEWSAVSAASDRAPVLTGVGIAALGVGLAGAAIALIIGATATSPRAEPGRAHLGVDGLEVSF